MSYEGYTQHICTFGHQYDADPYSDYDEQPCPHCKASSVFQNEVDETNCESYGVIRDWSSLEIAPAVVQECDLGYLHTLKKAKYRPPSPEELKKLRYWLDEDGTWKLCDESE